MTNFISQKTVWGECLSDKPLQEYPRPQMVRDSYLNLNGWWDYAIVSDGEVPTEFQGKILVPFSPESILSGVNRQLNPHEILFYKTTFTLPKNFNKGIVLLHFGAVDSICDVYVNNVYLCHHEGGYNPFTVDVTASLAQEENTLVVKVRDVTDTSFYTCGKQSTKRGGMWYTPQSGIWQTVWLESVPKHYISSFKITPNFQNASVSVQVSTNFDEPVTVRVLENGNELGKSDGKGTISVNFPDGKFVPWTPENPHLYDLEIISRRDYVKSYFGMRKFSVAKVGKYMRLMLNDKPYFHNGLLDQGYWSDGLYTAPSDDALISDVLTMKELGFNMLRKHIKVETLRWYYHCDRLGMLVWQDMPSGGTKQNLFTTLVLPNIGINKIKDDNYKRFSRESDESRETFMREYAEMIDTLYNCVSIAMWVPFNEGWGQFDAARIAEKIANADPTRTIDHASGWHDQKIGETKSLHVYFKKYVFKPDKLGRAVMLTEFGGYNYRCAGHSFGSVDFGYKKLKSTADLQKALEKLYSEQIKPAFKQGLSAAVYTQLSDVEEEVNGLVTYDRKVVKLSPETMRKIVNVE